MTPEQIQELIDKLLGMGETMAGEAFRASMEYTLVTGWAAAVVALLLLAIGIATIVYAYKEEGIGTAVLMAFLVVLLVGVVGGIAVPRLLTPEWVAITNILNLFP